MKLKRLFLALTLAFLARDVAAQPNNFPAEPQGFNRVITGIKPAARIVGKRPPGCPVRHCGCSLSLKIFGRIIPKLNLAANWLAFPRTSPRPGAVAARRGHAMQLIAHVRGDRWKVWDANSGGGKTRIHVRSVRGFVFVNPHAANVAEAR